MQYLQWMIKGLAMGAADVVPGVSGGTIAFITGIYDEWLSSLKRCTPAVLLMLKRDGEWVRAPWVDGTFVINLGDMFKVWTNDIYVSNQHRVVNRLGKERYSIPTFFNLDYDAPVRCLPT